MFESYFGIACDPFGMTPDPGFFYETRAHREAVASLHYSVKSDRGFTALIAPPGMGKTTILFRLLAELRQSTCSVFLFDTRYNPRDLLVYILRDLQIQPKTTTPDILEQFYQVLLRVERSGKRFVLVIDEAQNLSRDTLETVRLLSNFERPGRKLMHIILSGQMQLSDILLDPDMVQLRQRISTICRLQPLSAAETAEYIEHRLRWAGYNGPPIFAPREMQTIATFSGGIPRIINALCFNAMSICCALRRKTVDSTILAEAIADLQLPVSVPAIHPTTTDAAPALTQGARPRHVWRSGAALAAALLLSVLPGDRAMHRNSAPSASTDPAGGMFPSPLRNALSNWPVPSSVNLRQVTIEADQTLTRIAQQQLGRSDLETLLEIQSLNPDLENLDLIKTGQILVLPASSAVPLPTRTSHEP